MNGVPGRKKKPPGALVNIVWFNGQLATYCCYPIEVKVKKDRPRNVERPQNRGTRLILIFLPKAPKLLFSSATTKIRQFCFFRL